MNTIDEAIAVLQAMKEGKEIQYCPGLQHEWTVLRQDQNIYSVLAGFKCRVKTEPREFYINLTHKGHVCYCGVDPKSPFVGEKTIKVVEVIE